MSQRKKYIAEVCTILNRDVFITFLMWTQTLSTQILSWTRWILTEPWRSSRPVSAGASGSPWSPTGPGAGTAVVGAGLSRPPPWRSRHTTPPTDPTGLRRHLLPRRRTRLSLRGSTPRTWWVRCAAWSWPRAAQSAVQTKALRCDCAVYSMMFDHTDAKTACLNSFWIATRNKCWVVCFIGRLNMIYSSSCTVVMTQWCATGAR